jgi:flagellin-like hook-associated protein FlgL
MLCRTSNNVKETTFAEITSIFQISSGLRINNAADDSMEMSTSSIL